MAGLYTTVTSRGEKIAEGFRAQPGRAFLGGVGVEKGKNWSLIQKKNANSFRSQPGKGVWWGGYGQLGTEKMVINNA